MEPTTFVGLGSRMGLRQVPKVVAAGETAGGRRGVETAVEQALMRAGLAGRAATGLLRPRRWRVDHARDRAVPGRLTQPDAAHPEPLCAPQAEVQPDLDPARGRPSGADAHESRGGAATGVPRRVGARGHASRIRNLYALWAFEIGPDFWAFCLAGTAEANALRDLFALPPTHALRIALADPQSPPYLRALLAFVVPPDVGPRPVGRLGADGSRCTRCVRRRRDPAIGDQGTDLPAAYWRRAVPHQVRRAGRSHPPRSVRPCRHRPCGARADRRPRGHGRAAPGRPSGLCAAGRVPCCQATPGSDPLATRRTDPPGVVGVAAGLSR